MQGKNKGPSLPWGGVLGDSPADTAIQRALDGLIEETLSFLSSLCRDDDSGQLFLLGQQLLPVFLAQPSLLISDILPNDVF